MGSNSSLAIGGRSTRACSHGTPAYALNSIFLPSCRMPWILQPTSQKTRDMKKGRRTSLPQIQGLFMFSAILCWEACHCSPPQIPFPFSFLARELQPHLPEVEGGVGDVTEVAVGSREQLDPACAGNRRVTHRSEHHTVKGYRECVTHCT